MTVRFELFVTDVQASVDFYEKVLGFSQGRNRSENYAVMRNGETQIGLGAMSALSADHPLQLRHPGERKGVGVEIVLEVDDVHELFERVTASGYPVREALIRSPWGLQDFRLTDPDGYYLRITSRSEKA